MMLQGVWACAGLLAFVWIGATFGQACLAVCGLSRREQQEPAALFTAIGVGWGAISLLLLALGWMGVFRAAAFALVLASCGALGMRYAGDTAASWRTLWKEWRAARRAESAAERLAVWLLTAHAAISLVGAFVPPTFWDAITYHLALPKLFLLQGSLGSVDGANRLAATHLGTQLLYALGLSVGNEVWPAVLHWCFGVLLTMSAYWMGRRWWAHEAGVWAAACLYLTPLLNTLSGGAYIDLSLMWYACLGLWHAGHWVEGRSVSSALLLGLVVGFAACTKVVGLALIALFAAVMLTFGMRRGRISATLAACALMLVVAGLIVSPWLVTSTVQFGTPWSLLESDRKLGLARGTPIWSRMSGGLMRRAVQVARSVALAPARLTFSPGSFDGWRFSPGPWMIALVPLLALCRKIDRRVLAVTAWGAMTLLTTHLLSVQINRLFGPVYPAMALASGYVIWRSAEWGRIVARALRAAVCGWGVVNLGLLALQDIGRLPVIVGAQSRDAFLERQIDSFTTMRYANQSLPKDARILAMDPRVFYLDREYRIGDPGYQVWLLFADQSSPEMLLQTLRRAGITHLLINWSYVRRSEPGRIREELERFQWLWQSGAGRSCRLVYERGPVALYALQMSGHP